MNDATKVYVAYGRPVFDTMSMPPFPLDTMKVEHLVEGPMEFSGFGIAHVRLALVLARLREVEGRISDAVSFATYGLQHAVNAFGLKSELERIAALSHSAPNQIS